MIAESDLSLLLKAISEKLPPIVVSQDSAWKQSAAVSVIDCVLSLNRPYDRFVVPRVRLFAAKYPNVVTVRDLAALIGRFPTCHEFVQQELNYDHRERAETLDGVVKMLMEIVANSPPADEESILRKWAIEATPEEGNRCAIRGFKLAGWQYLRMLFGADTTKPDIHIVRFVRYAISQDVSPIEAHRALQLAAKRLNIRMIDLDTTIWEWSARRDQSENLTEASESVVHLFPWTDHDSLLEALRLRPSMWLGSKSLAALERFLGGWQSAERFHKLECPVLRNEKLEHFEQWIGKRKGFEHGGSFDLARKFTRTDEDAFDHWFNWYSEYKIEMQISSATSV